MVDGNLPEVYYDLAHKLIEGNIIWGSQSLRDIMHHAVAIVEIGDAVYESNWRELKKVLYKYGLWYERDFLGTTKYSDKIRTTTRFDTLRDIAHELSDNILEKTSRNAYTQKMREEAKKHL